jgi:HlyD family type I secretion membrane fusion protein
VASDLSETRAKLLDIMPRLQNARAALERVTVRAPYSGIVVGLSVFSVGGVIARGERLLDIVPEGTPLVVEAQIGVEDIADLRPGMTAEVHFTSYKQRTTPLIHGRIAEISADRLTDERTGLAYYKALIAVDPKELAATPEIQLYPGMPATVMITTTGRTALDYLIGPLSASFDRSFRQK